MSGRGQLTKVGFEKFLNSVGLFLPQQELSEMFRYFDNNNDNVIDSNEFAATLKMDITDKRLLILRQAFKFLDTNNRGSIHVQNL